MRARGRAPPLHAARLAHAAQHTGALGVRLAEAGQINKSLSQLGIVVTALHELQSGKRDHVPFREST